MSTDIQVSEKRDVYALLRRAEAQVERALPARIMAASRVIRIAETALRQDAKLAKCEPMSVLGAVVEAAQSGLEIGRTAYLVPFWSGKERCYKAQYVPGYRGLIELARRSGMIGPFDADIVRAGDSFAWRKGLNPDLQHTHGDERGELTHVWALAQALPKYGGWPQFEVMTRADLERHRDRYAPRNKQGNIFGPWVDDFPEMCRKTVIRKLCKLLPQTTEMQAALAMEDAYATGGHDARSVLEATSEPVPASGEGEVAPALEAPAPAEGAPPDPEFVAAMGKVEGDEDVPQ